MLGKKVQQVKKVLVAQNVTHQLMDLILNGSILPGEKLPIEKQLMEIFGIGRSSLREAIGALVALGLIEVRVPEGTFVAKSFGAFFTKQLTLMSKISFDNIIELIEARITIEAAIVELATKKVMPTDVEILKGIIDNMKCAVTGEAYQKLDLEFHSALARLCKNSFMYETMKILNGLIVWWMEKVAQNIKSSKEISIVQHENIVRAIQNKDVKAASIAMREHLQCVSELLLQAKKLEEDREASGNIMFPPIKTRK